MKPLLIASLMLLSAGFACGQEPTSKQESNLCQLDSLPSAIQLRLKQEYGSWRIQDAANLSQRAHKRWESEKPLACPGVAVGNFETSETKTYALLLVPNAKADAGYRFIVFSQESGQTNYQLTVLDKLDESGATNYFLRATPIGKFFDEASKKRFNAHAPNVILLFDAAEKEYEVDVYYWSGGHYKNDWVDY